MTSDGVKSELPKELGIVFIYTLVAAFVVVGRFTRNDSDMWMERVRKPIGIDWSLRTIVSAL